MTNTTSDLHGPTQLDLNPKPTNSVRLSKRAGFLGLAILGVVGILVFYGIGTRGERQFKLGFHPDEARNVTAATDVGKSIAAKVPARPGAETRDAAKPASGPEELTVSPMSLQPTRQSAPVGPIAPPPSQQFAAQQPPPQPTAEDRRRELAWQREQEALEAPTTAREGFTKGSATGSIASNLPTAQADMTQMTQLLQALQGPGASSAARGAGVVGTGGMPQISLGGQSASGAQEYKLQNSQDEKEEFLEQAKARKQEMYLGKTRVRPLGRFEIKAGWDIPAVLEQALNSDLPGEIKALVRENVYDTATGKYLLIPQGSRLVGNYSSRVSYGQNGIQVVWDRIVFPDGSSLVPGWHDWPGHQGDGRTS